MGSIAEEVRGSLGGVLAGAAGPSLIKVTLLGIATKAAAGLIKNAACDSHGKRSRRASTTGTTQFNRKAE